MHVPRNSYYDSVVAEKPDIFAPVIIKPNFVKSGEHGLHSITRPKVDVVRSYFGMCSSTTQLSPNNPVAMSILTISSHVLSLQRKEIMQSVISVHGEEDVQKLPENNHSRSIYESTITNHGGGHALA